MNDFKKKMNEKIKLYSNDKYLEKFAQACKDNNIRLSNENINEIMMSTSISDDDKLAFKNIIGKFRLATDKSELFDYRTMGDQLSLNSNVYEYIEDKTSMLENDVKINFHVRCPDVSKKEQEIVRHIFKEHYAIELYKIQKIYTRYRNKAISLIFIGVISFIMYIFLFFQDGFDMFQEIFAFLFSFSLWEGFDSLIYNLSDTRYEVGNVTQNLLLEVVFMEDIKENEENIENII